MLRSFPHCSRSRFDWSDPLPVITFYHCCFCCQGCQIWLCPIFNNMQISLTFECQTGRVAIWPFLRPNSTNHHSEKWNQQIIAYYLTKYTLDVLHKFAHMKMKAKLAVISPALEFFGRIWPKKPAEKFGRIWPSTAKYLASDRSSNLETLLSSLFCSGTPWMWH